MPRIQAEGLLGLLMLPAWIEKTLESAGILGAIIFVLLFTIAALVAYIKQIQGKADKVYGYRLAERDTLNKALSEAAEVIRTVVETTKERNALTNEQAELLEKQMHAFELLKASIIAQYDGIKDISHATSSAVQAMAEAVRTLTAQISENKYAYTLLISEVRKQIDDSHHETQKEVADHAQRVVNDIRSQLGNELTIIKRRKHTPTRPGGKS